MPEIGDDSSHAITGNFVSHLREMVRNLPQCGCSTAAVVVRNLALSVLFSPLGSENSLRDISNGLAPGEGKLRHLGPPRGHVPSAISCMTSSFGGKVHRRSVFQCPLKSLLLRKGRKNHFQNRT